jgi:3-hydroxyacyl-CoA dehydrogenase
MNRERLMADAKAKALERVREGYHRRRRARPSGGRRAGGRRAQARRAPGLARGPRQRPRRADRPQAGAHLRRRRRSRTPTTVSEQYLLDLEREAFLSLLGERKTLERIQHTLKTGQAAAELTLVQG